MKKTSVINYSFGESNFQNADNPFDDDAKSHNSSSSDNLTSGGHHGCNQNKQEGRKSGPVFQNSVICSEFDSEKFRSLELFL